MFATDNPTMHNIDIISNTESSPPVGLYAGVSVAVLFLLISLTILIIVVTAVKKKQGGFFLFCYLCFIIVICYLYIINLQVLRIKHKG